MSNEETVGMMDGDPGWRGKFAWVAFLFALSVAGFILVAALGSKFRLWDPYFGFGTLAVNYGSKLGMAAGALAVASLIIGFFKSPRAKPVILSIAAIFIVVMIMGRFFGLRMLAQSLPPLHDIQTSWDDPIQFSAELMAAREADGAKNPVLDDPIVPDQEGIRETWGEDIAGERVAVVQQRSEQTPDASADETDAPGQPYPPIEPLSFPMPAADVHAAALALVEAEGWTLVRDVAPDGSSDGVIEATETSFWFGFADDVAIRIRPVGPLETRVDMRSISRVGLSDLGANARRVATYLERLDRELR